MTHRKRSMVLEGRYWLQDIPEYAGLGLLGKTALLAGPAISEVCVRHNKNGCQYEVRSRQRVKAAQQCSLHCSMRLQS